MITCDESDNVHFINKSTSIQSEFRKSECRRKKRSEIKVFCATKVLSYDCGWFGSLILSTSAIALRDDSLIGMGTERVCA